MDLVGNLPGNPSVDATLVRFIIINLKFSRPTTKLDDGVAYLQGKTSETGEKFDFGYVTGWDVQNSVLRNIVFHFLFFFTSEGGWHKGEKNLDQSCSFRDK